MNPLAQLSDAANSPLWRDRLALLLESTGEGIFGIDLAGDCIFINRAAAGMLQRVPADVLGKNMHELVHHSHADGRHYPESCCPIFLAFRTGQPCRIDHEVFWRADGMPFAVEYSSHRIVDGGHVRGAVITFSDISRRRQAEEQLHRAKEDLELRVAERTAELSAALAHVREFSAHAHSVREEERRRIAREIHDELGSLLVGLKLDVKWIAHRVADREPVARKCDAMNRLIETAVENVGRIITDLRPSLLDHQGLVAALEWQLQEFSEATELRCDVRIDVAPDAHAPDGNLGTAVFRIFQEMLSNVARHAQAQSVRIHIAIGPTRLSIEVEDDGVGAPAAALADPRAYGVIGMRERAGHFGGRLEIAGRPGFGTRVRMQVPLPAKDDHER